MKQRTGPLYRDPTPRWQSTSKGVLILRRFGRQTLGIIVPNADGSFTWLSRAHDQGDRPARYATSDEAQAALLRVLRLAA
jgi:hypothetical protein